MQKRARSTENTAKTAEQPGETPIVKVKSTKGGEEEFLGGGHGFVFEDLNFVFLQTS